MPLFVYRCRVCGKETERLCKSLDRAPVSLISSDVPGHEETQGFCTQMRLFSASNFALRGDGWTPKFHELKGHK